jgi:peptidoglycan hydrolase CwlO-like protein
MSVKDSIVGWLATLKSKANSSSAIKKWILYMVVAIVAFFALAWLSNRAFRQWRELAELKHKMDVLKEEKHQAEVAKKSAQIKEKIDELDVSIQRKQAEIDLVDDSIRSLNEKWELEREKITALNDWDSLDQYVRDTESK